jgi:hypothetical protein
MKRNCFGTVEELCVTGLGLEFGRESERRDEKVKLGSKKRLPHGGSSEE